MVDKTGFISPLHFSADSMCEHTISKNFTETLPREDWLFPWNEASVVAAKRGYTRGHTMSPLNKEDLLSLYLTF